MMRGLKITLIWAQIQNHTSIKASAENKAPYCEGRIRQLAYVHIKWWEDFADADSLENAEGVPEEEEKCAKHDTRGIE